MCSSDLAGGGAGGDLAAAISGQADDSEAFFTGCIDGFQDVLAVAGRRNAGKLETMQSEFARGIYEGMLSYFGMDQ